ncbi:transcription factor 7-like 1-D [Corythoichthys intestinalis]|uniref:transcription factor 7-like 1-D n=1 Tax=Corythoichthys intestinalis TaxID=161448 RepID=UPI0025A67686|nr:transcription factor 7-like 1-D [Corythoichthys intestinalis]
MEPIPRGTCVEEGKWHEVLSPLYEPLADMSYMGNAGPKPPTTPIDPTKQLDCQLGFTGPQYSWSFDNFIRGDNVMNMCYRPLLDQGHMQPAQLNIVPDGDATNHLRMHYDNEGLLFQQYVNYQQLSYEWPATDRNAPTTPTSQFHEEPMMILPESETLPPAEMLSNADSVSPTRKVSTFRKRKREGRDDEEVYIKKPPNAFMIFRKEQRENVMAQLNIRDSAMANKALGRMWKSLSEKEQEKYYELADAEKRLHTQLHPNWSCTDNYGRKRRKQRGD